jgi:hypothetical protein
MAALIPIAMGLAQVAPQIIRWLSGSEKAEEAAEKVVQIAQAVAGQEDPMEALKTIRADPNKMLEFQQAVMANETELDKLYLADRADARKRDVNLAQLGMRNTRADKMVTMAAVGTIGGFASMAALGYLKAKYPEALNDGVFGALLSQVSTITAYFGLCLRDAFQFEFGSSRGSLLKTEMMANKKSED